MAPNGSVTCDKDGKVMRHLKSQVQIHSLERRSFFGLTHFPHLYHIFATLPIYLNSFFIQEELRDETFGSPFSTLLPPCLLSYPDEHNEDFMHQIPSGSNCHFRIHTVLMNAKTGFLLDRAWQDQQTQIREKLLAFQQRLINSDSIKSILINYAERYYCCL